MKLFGGRCHGRRDDDDDNRRKKSGMNFISLIQMGSKPVFKFIPNVFIFLYSSALPAIS